VMVDTRTGARLTRDGLSGSTDLDKATDEVVRRVGETLRRYPNGVKQIVGVSHFLSRCLTHAYDCYQTSCAELLAQILSQQPGVAVLEIEEARAISAELALTSPDEKDADLPDGRDALEHRVVPVLVSGEFLASRQGAIGSETDRFEVTVTIQRRGESEVVRATDLDQEHLVEFLSATLPDKILVGAVSDTTDRGALSADTQSKWLMAEADRFARIGMWERAFGLREAALLLRPGDTDLRFQLIDAYHRQMKRFDDSSERGRNSTRSSWRIWSTSFGTARFRPRVFCGDPVLSQRIRSGRRDNPIPALTSIPSRNPFRIQVCSTTIPRAAGRLPGIATRRSERRKSSVVSRCNTSS
jgi:hypothetical protein